MKPTSQSSETRATRGDNWPARLRQAAFVAGYEWRYQEIGVALGNMVRRHGIELVQRAFFWWIRNAARIERSPAMITPQKFAAKVGYWIHMSEPWNPY